MVRRAVVLLGLNTGAPCRVRHVIPSNLVLGGEETRKKCSYFIYWCFLLCCWWRHDGRSPVSAQLIQWNIHHARYSHTQNVVAGTLLSLSLITFSLTLLCLDPFFPFILCFHILSLCVVFLLDFLCLFVFHCLSFSLSFAFLYLWLFVSFLNSRGNAPNSSMHLRRPAIRAPHFCCSWYCRTSEVGQMTAQWWGCTHVISMLDLIWQNFFSVWQTLYNGPWTLEVDLWKV